jgi:hypothetical protein
LSIVDLVFIKFLFLTTQGISSTAVLVRAEAGVSYDKFTPKTVKATNSAHPAIALKFNQTTKYDSMYSSE